MSKRGSSPVLVGRAAELAALVTAVETVRQGDPAAMLIGGEAGMGKTRLISEFTVVARDAGVRVLTGACLELGADGLPFSPFTAMLRELVREVGLAEISGLLSGSGRALRELARLLPELAADRRGAAPAPSSVAPSSVAPSSVAPSSVAPSSVAPSSVAPSSVAPSSVAPAADAGDIQAAVMTAGEARAHLFEGFLTLLERLAEQRPLALIIEDAHWADRSSRDLLAFLVGYQRAVGNLLIMVTFRSDELHRTHPLRPLIAELGRIEWVDRIELPPLSRGEAEELAAVVRGRSLDRGAADAIYERAQGNPLFTEELLACSDSCDLMPDSLADLLVLAVRRLPEDTQEVLRVASAGSGVTGDRLLAEVARLDEGDFIAAVRPAVAANVLVTSGDGYSFRHALIQEAVHRDLLPGEHAAVHTRFARAIDADPSLVPPGRVEVEKAHHWYSAHNTTGALTGSWRASVQASNAVAHAERLMLLDRVLELWEQVPDAAAQIGTDHVRVLEEAASAAADAGEYQRGLAFAELALAQLDEATEPIRVALLLRRRFWFRKELGKGAVDSDLHRALELVPESVSPAARTELLLAVSHCHMNMDDESQFRTWATDALRLAQELGNRDAEAQALVNLAFLEAGRSQVATGDSDAYRLLSRAHTLARQASAYHPAVKMIIGETHLLCGAGEYESAVQAARQGIADAERHGLARTGGAFLAINLAEPLCYLGQWDEAVRVATRALDLAPPPRTRVWLWLVNGTIALARGDVAAAAGRARACRAVLSTRGYDEQDDLPLAMLDIDVALAADGPDAAVAVAADALQRYDVSIASPRFAWPLLVSAATAATGTAGEEATALLDRLRVCAEKLDAFGPVQRAWRLSYAMLDPAAQLSTGISGDGGRLAVADAAAGAWEAVGQPYQAAIALTYAARIALAEQAGRKASERLRRAAPIAERLGAGPLAGQIADLTARPGTSATTTGATTTGATTTGATTTGAGTDARDLGLTSRELEVLRLVAAGQSNREIAGALVISPKTASVHVSNILAKLGAATRTEAAVKAHQLLLLGLPAAVAASLRLRRSGRSRPNSGGSSASPGGRRRVAAWLPRSAAGTPAPVTSQPRQSESWRRRGAPSP
jgi:predicted ATPase/DNA-binding CsgD family transcriptional regulator